MFLGIDASISSTGFAVINNKGSIVECGKITTKPKENEDDRVYKITMQILNLLEKYDIKSTILESQFFSRNVKTTMQLSRLRGAITFVVKYKGIDIKHKTPSEVRKDLMGDGSAGKEEVAFWLRDFYKDNKIMNELGEFCDRQCKAKNSDIYDAIAIALSEILKIK